MALATNTHEFKEAIQHYQRWEKVGEYVFLWGLIKFPKGVIHHDYVHTKLCERCMQKEFTSIHGYHKVNSL